MHFFQGPVMRRQTRCLLMGSGEMLVMRGAMAIPGGGGLQFILEGKDAFAEILVCRWRVDVVWDTTSRALPMAMFPHQRPASSHRIQESAWHAPLVHGEAIAEGLLTHCARLVNVL